jgi:hypothetical protein
MDGDMSRRFITVVLFALFNSILLICCVSQHVITYRAVFGKEIVEQELINTLHFALGSAKLCLLCDIGTELGAKFS